MERKRRQSRSRALVALFIILGLPACKPAATPTATPAGVTPANATPVPSATARPTNTPEPSPVPATQTPLPTPTPQPELQEPEEDQTLALRPAFAPDLAALEPLSRYWIELDIDPDRATLRGQQLVRYVNRSESWLDAIYMRLLPNLPGYGGDMRVSDVSADGAPVTPTLAVERTALRVPLPAALEPGAVVDLALSFAVRVPTNPGDGYGQFLYARDIMALANFYPLIPRYDEGNCERFGNCDGGWNIEYAVPYGDAVYSDTALYAVRVTAPAGWTVVSTGSTVEQETLPDGRVRWRLVSGPTRDFNLVLSPLFEQASTRVDDVIVTSSYLPEDAAGGKRALEWAADALAYFEQTLGPYPFAEFDVVETANVAGGIEYPGLIAMPANNYAQTGGFFQWATVHEVAHQWWYSLVGNDQQDEPWLDEALAQYSTALFYEFQVGWESAVEEVFESSYEVIAGTGLDDWIDRPVAAYSEGSYGPVVYSKGPLFFDALRERIGNDAFFALLQDYLQTYRYQNASRADLLAIIDRSASQDLSDLYREWLSP